MAGGAKPEPTAHRVGAFILRRWLAQGGMAELYLASAAEPPDNREIVVLKRVLPQFSSNTNFVRMFTREARLASVLTHPNIVAVHDAGGLGAEDCFFTMEYVHGADLGVLLGTLRQRSGALPLAHALTIAIAMCKGLHYAHEARDPDGTPLGIVHRDVSPSNVLLDFNGSVKITDFGVAKALAMTQLTQEGTRKGKLAYMSPEQATGETVDRRADVFAIAAVLYELTTMERLFKGDNDLAIMYGILQRPRPKPRDTNPGYPAALEHIVLRAVSMDSTERFETALELQQALEQFAQSVGLTLSHEALGAFVKQTLPRATHPRDDPKLWRETTSLRAQSRHAITIADALDTDEGNTGSGPSEFPATQAQDFPPIMRPPSNVPPSASASAPQVHASPHSASVIPLHQAPAAPSSKLHVLSASLAALALLVAVGVAVMLWQSRTEQSDTPTTPAAVATDPAPSTQPAASPSAPPTAPPTAPAIAAPVPAVETPAPVVGAPVAEPPVVEPAPSDKPKPRSKSKKAKKRPAAPTPVEPAPAPKPEPTPPPSTKPSPTDTLLPIRE